MRGSGSSKSAEPFPDSQFDVVISVNALDHVQNFETAISEIYRVLKPNGKIYLSFNYQDQPTATEPIVLSDKRVEEVLSVYFAFAKVKSEPTEFGYSKNCYHGSKRV
jgi:ubiquinone/menaquinone biosynthesis C-methylase UbiE